jgi:hypothetical protein
MFGPQVVNSVNSHATTVVLPSKLKLGFEADPLALS